MINDQWSHSTQKDGADQSKLTSDNMNRNVITQLLTWQVAEPSEEQIATESAEHVWPACEASSALATARVGRVG